MVRLDRLRLPARPREADLCADCRYFGAVDMVKLLLTELFVSLSIRFSCVRPLSTLAGPISMTDRSDVARGRTVVERWCLLAEQRLDYLTELYESGRWRRFHTELDFLDNIQEAKRAVNTWRGLLTSEASPDNRPIDLSWLGSDAPLAPRRPAVFADELPPAMPRTVRASGRAGAAGRARRQPGRGSRRHGRARAARLGSRSISSLMQQRYPLLRPSL